MVEADDPKAGPDLDRQVHARIIGGRVFHEWVRHGETENATCVWCGKTYSLGLDSQPPPCEAVPPYSTKERASDLIVVAMTFRLEMTLIGVYRNWRCRFSLPQGGRSFEAVAETRPLAICRAALKALSGSPEERELAFCPPPNLARASGFPNALDAHWDYRGTAIGRMTPQRISHICQNLMRLLEEGKPQVGSWMTVKYVDKDVWMARCPKCGYLAWGQSTGQAGP